MLPVQPEALAHKGGVAPGRVAFKIRLEVKTDLRHIVLQIRETDTGGDTVAQRHIRDLLLRFSRHLNVGGQSCFRLQGLRCGILCKCRNGQQHQCSSGGKQSGEFLFQHKIPSFRFGRLQCRPPVL